MERMVNDQHANEPFSYQEIDNAIRYLDRNQGADIFCMVEGNMGNEDIASSCSVLRHRRPQTGLEASCTRTGRHRSSCKQQRQNDG